jgi:hypothetical protein
MSHSRTDDPTLADTLAHLRQAAEYLSPQVGAGDVNHARAHAQSLPRCDYTTEKMTDLRRNFQTRIEAFRNRQRLLQIERETYYSLTVLRIRGMTDQWATNQPRHELV